MLALKRFAVEHADKVVRGTVKRPVHAVADGRRVGHPERILSAGVSKGTAGFSGTRSTLIAYPCEGEILTLAPVRGGGIVAPGLD